MSWIIRLQHLPLSANASDIRAFFSGLRIPDGSVHIVGGPDGDAFIGFATDEDARQAMKFDNRRIHDQRVKLLLSSRVEMDAVIAKARSGDLNLANVPVTSSAITQPLRHEIIRAVNGTSEQQQHQTNVTSQVIPTSTSAISTLYALRNTPNINQNNSYQQEFIRGVDNGETWNRNENASDSWKNTNTSNYDGKQQQQQRVVLPWQDPKMLNVIGQTTTAPIYHQTRDERYNQYESESFQGYTASLQPSSNSAVYQQHIQNAAEDRRYQGSQKIETPNQQGYQGTGIVGSVLSGQSLQIPPTLSSISPSTVAGTNARLQNSGSVLPSANPFAVYPHNVPIFPPVASVSLKHENRYVELSRLPSELLRPAALEQFLQPAVPLTLSSVKVIFDPKGFPLHSLVRFENVKDAENILNRDGEQGIRIRPSSKEIFDAAVDGSLQIPAYYLQNKNGQRVYDRNREDRGRERLIGPSSRRHHSPERRDVDPRRDERPIVGIRDREHRLPRRGRSRTPPSLTRDLRDTKRRREDTARFCIEFTNLPFRVSEAEIREFFGVRCQPVKVSRAYNADGQASDRWILEFGDMDTAERAYRTRGKIQDRLIRARRLTNEEADNLLSVPDKFGLQKKEEYERKFGQAENVIGDTSSSHLDGMTVPLMNGPFPQANFRGRGRGRAELRGGMRGNFETDNPSGMGRTVNGPLFNGPTILPGAAATKGVSQEGNGLSAGSSTASPLIPGNPAIAHPMTYRHQRSNGPLIQGGPPRPPLIRPPTFFGATPSSTIRQRGPPPTRGSRGSLSHRVVHSGHVDNASSSKQTYVALENVPESCSDQDIVAFLDIKPSKMSKSATIQHALNGTVFVDLGNVDDALKAVSKNQQKIGENVITVTAVNHQQMQKKMESNTDLQQKMLEPDLIASVGEPGTVISCDGFPPNVTLADVSQFFNQFSLVESSVKIKLDDRGMPTGECLLSLGSVEEARKAASMLNGRKLNGSAVTLTLVQAKQ